MNQQEHELLAQAQVLLRMIPDWNNIIAQGAVIDHIDTLIEGAVLCEAEPCEVSTGESNRDGDTSHERGRSKAERKILKEVSQ